MATVLEYAYLSSDVYVENKNGTYINDYYVPECDVINANWVGLPAKHEKRLPVPKPELAFFARLYANRVTKETVIAYRGTVASRRTIGDFIADIDLSIKKWSEQDTQAEEFYQWAKKYLANYNPDQFSLFPSFTGHSLGGYLAQLVAAQNPGNPAVVFNAPGIGKFKDHYIGYIKPDNPIYKRFIYNYDLNTDIIHHTGTLIGNQKILSGDPLPPLPSMLFKAPYDTIRTGLSIAFYEFNFVKFSTVSEHAISRMISALAAKPKLANKIIYP